MIKSKRTIKPIQSQHLENAAINEKEIVIMKSEGKSGHCGQAAYYLHQILSLCFLPGDSYIYNFIKEF